MIQQLHLRVSTEENKNVLTNKTNLGTSCFTVMKSLIWLHMKLTFCDFKRIILPILLVAGSIIAVWVASIMTPPYKIVLMVVTSLIL